ncbi:MAG: MFS transporter, partial [Thermoguttaceae bacterium]
MANLMPKSVPYLVANEGAERFSYYGNNVILMVYMTGAYIGMSEGEAAGWIHLFKGAVYFFPLFGALLADVFWGKYRTIFWLSLVYCLGHLIMALPGSWFHDLRVPLFWGLAFIALGSGGIKSCASALVGDQFTAENQHLMNRVYNWYYLAINIGAFVSSLLTPWLLKHYGPEWAFGVPGVLMGVATLIFWLGRKKYRVAKASGKSFLKDLTDRASLWCLGKISLVFVFLII